MEKEWHILVVDDEEDICEILKYNLELEGYVVDVAHSAEEALEKELSFFDLILLDVMMGEMSGYEMARVVRRDNRLAAVPIIFLTALDSEDDMIRGLNMGGDDYISKPFSIREVQARVRAVLRRSQYVSDAPTSEEPVVLDGLKIDTEQKLVMVDGETVFLTPIEFGILQLLLSHPKKIFSREEILTDVWKEDVYVLDRTVDVNITRLRKKLGSYGNRIVTRSGYGYCFE